MEVVGGMHNFKVVYYKWGWYTAEAMFSVTYLLLQLLTVKVTLLVLPLTAGGQTRWRGGAADDAT